MVPLKLSFSRADLEDVCRRRHIRRLSVFGSVLRDDFGPDSDVDLLVEFEPGHVVGFAIIDVEADLSRVFGGRRVDSHNPKFLNRHLKDGILSSSELLYEAQGS
jgi:predicted nucleotidyltransferase